MPDEQTISLVIQPPRSVFKDIVLNRRWIAGIATLIVLYAVISATIFSALEGDNKQIKNWVDSFYFTIINLTTVGFGDIFPITLLGNVLAIFNSLIGVAAFGFLVACITAALQPSKFNATGTINKVDGPPKGSDTDASSRRGAPETSEQATIMLLNSLNALIGTPEQPPREGPVYIRLATKEGHKLGAVIEVHILVHRPSG
jgi:hypothetical protein